MRPVVLTIAGADPSGGAGVQSDLRTFVALEVDGISAVTALTAQNSLGVSGVYPVEEEALRAQLKAVLDDTRPDAVKIGMLGTVRLVEAVAEILNKRSLPNVILDPVLTSSGGVPLLDTAGRYLLIASLLSFCTVVTPNLSEAQLLTGLTVKDADSMIAAGRQLLSMGARAVLVKGGHLPSAPSDWLLQRGAAPIEFIGRRIRTTHTHGTGCLLSAAIAAGLAKGLPLENAVGDAKSLLEDALQHPMIHGTGRGCPDVAAAVQSRGPAPSPDHLARIAKFSGLYVVTDPVLQSGRSHEDIARLALAGGARIIQLRDKTLSTPELVRAAKSLSEIVHDKGCLFIVNDRVDVALASDADGVHIGPDDMGAADVRRLIGPDKLLGVSTGTLNEAVAAAPYASYFGVGCIYGTATKCDAGEPVTPSRISEVKARFPAIPVVAIGGVNASNIREVIAAGADSAAVVSAVVAKKEVDQAARVLANFF